MLLRLVLLSCFIPLLITVEPGSASVVVYFDFPPGHASYSGFFDKDTTIIELTPPLKVAITPASISRKLCSIIFHHEGGIIFPFYIPVTNAAMGVAEIHMIQPIDFSFMTDRYVFEIEAKDCDDPPHVSGRVFVSLIKRPHVTPVMHFDFKVVESQPMGALVGRITASDQQAIVCNYTIESPSDPPFYIEHSVIRTSKVLHFHETPEYHMTVKSNECQPRTDPFLANIVIRVEKSCVPGWNLLSSSSVSVPPVEYGWVPLWTSRDRKILPTLDMCGLECQSVTVKARVTVGLHSEMGSNYEVESNDPVPRTSPEQCALDEKSQRMQRNVCSASEQTIELLPSIEDYSRRSAFRGGGPVHSLTRSLEFDGKSTFWRVEDERIPASHILGSSFTIAFWMRHGNKSNGDIMQKEQILCNADGESMNRQHYSLYIQNCHLVLLWRREHQEDYTFSPAQWTFDGEEIEKVLCHNPDKWQHFSLTKTQGNQLELFVDGVFWQQEPKIVDDLPLHAAHLKVSFTVLSVGACFEGRTGKYIQHFHGDLAGLTLLRDGIETSTVLQCLANCGERLPIYDLDKVMRIGTGVSLAQTEIQVTGTNASHVARVLAQVHYANTDKNRQTQVGDITRKLALHTSVKCNHHDQEGSEMNLPVQTLTITLRGTKDFIKLEIMAPSQITGKDWGTGLPLLDGVRFITALGTQGADAETIEKEILTSCVLRVSPNLDEHKEYFIWSPSLARDLGLSGMNNSHGLVLDNLQSAADYLRVLQTVRYHYAFQPGDEPSVERTFGLQCAQKNEHVTLEKFIKLTILSSDERMDLASTDYLSANHHSNLDTDSLEDRPLNGHFAMDNSAKFQRMSSNHHDIVNIHEGLTKTQLIMSILLPVCGLFFLAIIIVVSVQYCRHRTRQSQMLYKTNTNVRPIVLYRNPLELQSGESLVEYGFPAGSQQPFCPVDMDISFHHDGDEYSAEGEDDDNGPSSSMSLYRCEQDEVELQEAEIPMEVIISNKSDGTSQDTVSV
jgi:calsyntenin 1